MRHLTCFGFLFVLAACGSTTASTTVDVTSFDQSCKAATDCTAVINGSVCACNCPNAAINTNDLASYTQAEEAAAMGCPAIGLDCAECPAVTVVCQQGKVRAAVTMCALALHPR